MRVAEQVAHPIQAQTNNTTPNASTARLLLADRTVLANIQLTRSSELMQEIQRMRSVIRTLEEQIEVTTRSLEAMDRLVVHLQRVTDLLHEVGVMPAVAARRAGSTSHVWGYVIVLLAALVFISSMYVMVFSKLLLLLPEAAFPISQEADGTTVPNSQRESEGFGLLLALESDVYYCFLVPLTIPVTILACYANWVSLKFFRHN
ncbi:hypothetical protein JG687_00012833 [Phytophthora cactorum]|uniref:Uncharacterized protein n=1 Tax=Phytophthora cactorum TaxID=29920 RepID=A0A8T1U4C3_9STRA|nr:hypothetical protein JG687_00012833 [Phytophthora cactorum]